MPCLRPDLHVYVIFKSNVTFSTLSNWKFRYVTLHHQCNLVPVPVTEKCCNLVTFSYYNSVTPQPSDFPPCRCGSLGLPGQLRPLPAGRHRPGRIPLPRLRRVHLPARDELCKNGSSRKTDTIFKRSSRKIDSRRLFSREYDFPKTFSLTENQFSGKTYLCTLVLACYSPVSFS